MGFPPTPLHSFSSSQPAQGWTGEDSYRYEGDAEDLGLTFAVEDETFGRRVSYPLVPGGAEVAVTSHNRLQYVLMAADWHLNGRLGGSSAAFARGINQVGNWRLMRMSLGNCGQGVLVLEYVLGRKWGSLG